MPAAPAGQGLLATPAGEARWRLDDLPDGGRGPLVVLAHGAGAGLESAFLEHVARGLVDRGLPVLRFEFAYMTRAWQTGRRRLPDGQPALLAAFTAALACAREVARQRPLVGVGKSLGGRMLSLLLAEAARPPVTRAAYLGFPLHPRGQPERLRTAHLGRITVPQLFISGDRDLLARRDLLEPAVSRLGPGARLLIVPGDHSLAPSRREPFRDAAAWLDALAAFCLAPEGHARP